MQVPRAVIVLVDVDEAVALGKLTRTGGHENILYMAANSEATYEVQTFGPYRGQFLLLGVCVLVIGLYGWYLFRRHCKMVAWKAQQAA